MSAPVTQIVDLGFSVADGEKINISYENQVLRVSFVDWHEAPVAFVCHDTIAFRWQEAEYLVSPEERFDSSYDVLGSAWLQQHQEQSMTREGIRFHHYKLNFNAAGILEMLCSRIERIASD
jgi:hypothetical protein